MTVVLAKTVKNTPFPVIANNSDVHSLEVLFFLAEQFGAGCEMIVNIKMMAVKN